MDKHIRRITVFALSFMATLIVFFTTLIIEMNNQTVMEERTWSLFGIPLMKQHTHDATIAGIGGSVPGSFRFQHGIFFYALIIAILVVLMSEAVIKFKTKQNR